jgi:aminocarboxymuconate-semialdehyde decarboxylase
MQDVSRTLDEMRYGVDRLGLRAFEICTNVNGQDLDSAEFRPFWKLAADLDVLIFLHPPVRQVGLERMGDFFLNNLVGNPMETTIAGARLIFSGVLEEFPGLKILLAHGGGMLPYQIGRFDRGFRAHPSASAHLRRPPSEYLGSFYYDTILFDEKVLSHLFHMVPADRIVFGSDCPFEMQDDEMRERLSRVPGVTTDDMANVLGGNARRLLLS